MGVGGQRHAPPTLPPGKTRYPLYKRLGRPQSRSGQVRKLSPPTGIRSPDRPARSKSLYWLSYPGSWHLVSVNNTAAEHTYSRLTLDRQINKSPEKFAKRKQFYSRSLCHASKF